MDFSKTIILSVIHLLSLLIDGHEVPLNRDDLRKKYGQGTLFQFSVEINFFVDKMY